MKVPSNAARILIAVIGCALLMAAAVDYIRIARQRGPVRTAPHVASAVEQDLGTGPRIQVLSNGVLSMVSRDHPEGPRLITSQTCDRAYAAADTIVCLRPVNAFTGTRLVVLDAQLRERRSIPLTGFPNRARVSPSGRMVAWTLFIDGHSYTGGSFSTNTGILDTRDGTVIASLEEFAVLKDGRRYRAADLNFWGVTFADDNRFYASMSTGSRRYLVEGDIAARQLHTLAQDVECPSLSPDGARIAFKHTIHTADAVGSQSGQSSQGGGHGGHDGPGITWRLSVLNLATQSVTHLAETRSVDDQAVWLDDNTVAYGLQRPDGVNDVWAVPADGTGTPRVLVPEANSPALVQAP
jgi:hypothetical protein